MSRMWTTHSRPLFRISPNVNGTRDESVQLHVPKQPHRIHARPGSPEARTRSDPGVHTKALHSLDRREPEAIVSIIVFPDGTVIKRAGAITYTEVDVKSWVVHCKKARYDVYVGRPGKWGNPIVLKRESEREAVLEEYIEYLNDHPQLMEDAKRELKGKVLGCWCAPRLCHAEVLAQIANE